MSEVDIRAAAAPKSDQLNADDLAGGTQNITVTAVKSGNKEQPIVIHYDGENGRPYKPCKSMMRVLMTAWGDKGKDWVGKSMTLFNDPTVKWAGVEVGGIRISHVSDIKTAIAMSVTLNRKQRKPYRVEPLVVVAPVIEHYPLATFNEKLPAMLQAIESGKMTVDGVIAHCNKTGPLTEEQKAQLNTQKEAPADEQF